MSVPSSVEELIQLIRKSGMIEDHKITAYLQRREFGRGMPSDAREAADDMVRDGLLTYFQAEQFLLGKWRGFTIGKFKLLERVGVGGMGQVFLCEHMFMKRRVAVKVLPPAKAEQPAALGRFYREARAAGSLEHDNIVRTHDIDQDGNLHFIVMEYVNGSNLLDVVKKFGPMDIGRAVYYTQQSAIGLEYAFRNGLIHRDIKPGNILIDRHGNAKILDMGLARFYNDQSDQLTKKYDDKIVLGTADYVAPEQVANSHAVDIRADIYALGATLYFLLAGHPPFPSGTVSQKLLWHRTKEPTPIREIRPEVPEGLAAVLARMMSKDPNRRYHTPAEVATELNRWIPAEVPLPNSEEMPQLSPAAEAIIKNEFEDVAPAAVAESRVPVGAGVGGGQKESFRSTPTPPKAFSNATGPFSPNANNSNKPVFPPSPFRPNSRADVALPPSPFAAGAQADIPTNGAAAATDTNRTEPLPSRATPLFAPAHAPVESRTKQVRKIVVVAVVATLIGLAGGVGYWMFMKPPEKQQLTTQGAPTQNN